MREVDADERALQRDRGFARRWPVPGRGRARPAVPVLTAALVGIALGILAQVFRQQPGNEMQLGAATAPWVTVGFALATAAAGRERAALVTYLYSWLVSYHVLYAVGQSVPFTAAFKEALPWLALAVPACLVLAPFARAARSGGRVGDACLGMAIAWSVPETIDNTRSGHVVAAVLIAVSSLLPVAVVRRREIRLETVLVSAVVLAAVALTLGPLVRDHIHS